MEPAPAPYIIQIDVTTAHRDGDYRDGMLLRRLVDQTWAPAAGQEPHVLHEQPPFPSGLAVRPRDVLKSRHQ